MLSVDIGGFIEYIPRLKAIYLVDDVFHKPTYQAKDGECVETCSRPASFWPISIFSPSLVDIISGHVYAELKFTAVNIQSSTPSLDLSIIKIEKAIFANLKA